MKTVLVLLALVAISLGRKIKEDDSLVPEKVEHNLEVFVTRLGEWDAYWKELSNEDRDMLMKIIEERVEHVKKDVVPKPMELEVDVADLPEIPPTPYLSSHLNIRSSSDLPAEDIKKIDEFLTAREDWNKKWHRMKGEDKERLEKMIGDRMERHRHHHEDRRHHSEGKRPDREDKRPDREDKRPDREGRRHHGHHEHHNNENVEKIMDYVRERVSKPDTDFPTEADKVKINEMIKDLPERAQSHIKRTMEMHHKKFEKLSDEEKQVVMKKFHMDIMSRPDKETREKHRKEAGAVFEKIKNHVKSRLAEKDTKFPEASDFEAVEKMAQDLPEHMKGRFMKKIHGMKTKFEKIPEDKKEKFRTKMMEKIERMEKHRPSPAMYTADSDEDDSMEILGAMVDSEESDESNSSEE